MIYLLFSIGDDRYALESDRIVEVVPHVELWPMPKAPAYVAGMFRYRGRLVPVIDLGQLIHDRPCPSRLSTRILLVNDPSPDGAARFIGLLVERVTDTLHEAEATFVSTGIRTDDAPYLGDTATDEQGMIHRIRPEALLSAPMRDVLAKLGDA